MSNREQLEDILIQFNIALEDTDICTAADKAIEKLDELIWDNIYTASGWTWAEACILTYRGIDVRKYNMDKLIPRIQKDLAGV